MMLDLVGVRYADKGRDPETGFSCWGLCRWVLNTELGLELPDKAPYCASWPRWVTIYRKPLPPLQKYDLVMFDEILPGLVNHMGVMVSKVDFIHSESHVGGVVCEPISRHQHMLLGIGRPRI